MRIWQYFYRGGTPEYLAKHYWWAYIWRFGVWFFDHQPIISSILFGQYQSLLDATKQIIGNPIRGKTLQIACVYGKLTPSIAQNLATDDLHIIDVATVQLAATRHKLNSHNPSKNNYFLTKMNAEYLAFADNCFDTALIFFLLHEMPMAARERTITEALRVLNHNGRLIITEYGELTETHLFHRIGIIRYFLGVLEPFLPGFWRQSLDGVVKECASQIKKTVSVQRETLVFNRFYRVIEYKVAG